MDEARLSARRGRVEHANAIMAAMARHGRRFFHHEGKVTRFELDDRHRLWLVDKYTQARIWMHGNHRWRHFSDGGTLKALCEALCGYIMTGQPISNRHFGPWPDWKAEGDLWGYGDDAMKALRLDIQASPAIHPGGRRGTTIEKTMESMPHNAQINPLTLEAQDVRLILSGHVTAFRRPFTPSRPWPEINEYGPVNLDSAGFSALTPARSVEFRGCGKDVGPWSKFQPLDLWKGDVLWVRENWSVAAAMDAFDENIRGVWPVRYAADGAVDRCGTEYGSTDGRIRAADGMPVWASRLTLEMRAVAVTRLSKMQAIDLECLDLTVDDNAADWDSRNPDGPASSEDPLVVTYRFVLQPHNVLDLDRGKRDDQEEAVPDLISMEDA